MEWKETLINQIIIISLKYNFLPNMNEFTLLKLHKFIQIYIFNTNLNIFNLFSSSPFEHIQCKLRPFSPFLPSAGSDRM